MVLFLKRGSQLYPRFHQYLLDLADLRDAAGDIPGDHGEVAKTAVGHQFAFGAFGFEEEVVPVMDFDPATEFIGQLLRDQFKFQEPVDERLGGHAEAVFESQGEFVFPGVGGDAELGNAGPHGGLGHQEAGREFADRV